jgi:PAS domain S-box-containing protein
MDSEIRAPSREGLLDRVFHGSLVGMIAARLDDGHVLEANDALASLLGRSLGELLGADVFELDLWGELGPDRARAALIETGLIDGYDTSVHDLNGNVRIVRVWAEVVNGGEPVVVIRASDVDGRATAGARYLELRETEVRYRAIVEQMPAITYTQVDDPSSPTGFRDVYISPQSRQLLGIPPDEWLSDPAAWLEVLHPEDRPRVLEDLERCETERMFRSEYRMIARDGSTHWFRDEAVFVQDPVTGVALWQGIMLDVTAERQAADHHAETEAKYRNLVEQMPAAVYLGEYGEDGDWLYISPQIERLLGYGQQEWLDHPAPMGQLTHPDDLPAVREEEERSLRTGTPFHAEYRMRRRDGRYVWILDEASIVRDEDGQPICMQGMMFDISARKGAEERLVALDGLKNTLLHTLSHDLKEPLTAILGAASTLERLDQDLDPAERGDLLRTMVERTKGMSSLLTDLLDLDRLDRGIIEPRRFPVELGDLVRTIVERSDALRGRMVETDAQHTSANVDTAKIERMVENLLANAARHTPVGSHIWVRVWREDVGAMVAVEDDGPGIPDEMKDAIFQPFRRGTESPMQPGSGIGLSLVARFAELHGGRAWVEDRPGGGAAFRIWLPDETRDARTP